MGYPQDYGIDNALKELSSGKISDVTFTESGGVIKEVPLDNGGYKVQMCEPVDSNKGHITADYYYDSNGNYVGYEPHNP